MISAGRCWCSISTYLPYLPVRQPRGLNVDIWGAPAPRRGARLVRVRVADMHEIVWETVITGRRVESLPILQEAIYGLERRLGLQGSDASSR